MAGPGRWRTSGPSFVDAAGRCRRALVARLGAIGPFGRDALVYGASAAFALLTIWIAGISLYREWASMALVAYAAAACVSAVLAVALVRAAHVPGSRATTVLRGALAVVAFGGATVLPLTMEVIWRSEGNAAAHVQPEVIVVEHAGARAESGRNPYQVVDRSGHILIHPGAFPTYELYYPYLPGMVLFGFSSASKVEARLTDARIEFLLFTAVVGGAALWAVRRRGAATLRAAEVLLMLPTGALPIATGGDDMPVVGLMLAGTMALYRRRPVLAGLALGAASSLKFTAWPLAVLAAFAASDRSGRRRLLHYILAVSAVVVPVVAPFAIHNPSAFVDNVIRFPLGLAGVRSPAASPLPGHLLVSAFPSLHREYVAALLVVLVAGLAWQLARRPPRTARQVAVFTAVAMTVGILLAPATRVGYLLYPANLFVWAWVCREPVPAEEEALTTSCPLGTAAG